jgi:polar amino acid transport system substrate-binding protein
VKIPTWQALALVLSCLSGTVVAANYRCVSLQYPPLIHQDEHGEVNGLAVELVTEVFKRMGHGVSVEVLPWARSLALMQAGERDCIFTIFRNAEREAFLDFNQQSIIPQVVYFYSQKNAKIPFNGNMAQLLHYRIGTVNKINYGPQFEENRGKMLLEEVGTLEQNFQKLALGRVDLVPSNFYTASYTLEQAVLKPFAGQLVKLPVPVDTVPSFIGFSKERKLQALAIQFDVEFKKMARSGLYQKLLKKYNIKMTPELKSYLQSF